MGCFLFAQTTGIAASVSQKADSLRGVFVSATTDTGKVAALTELSYLFRNSWPDSTLMYADRAIRFCETKNLPALFPQWAGYANAIGNKAIGYRLKGEYLRAQEYYFRALAMDCKLGNANGRGKRFVGISQMYLNTGNNPKALEYAYKALAQSKTNKNKRYVALSTGTIGQVYLELANYGQAMTYTSAAYQVFKEIKDVNNIVSTLTYLGRICTEQKDVRNATLYFREGLLVADANNLDQSKAEVLHFMGVMYTSTGEYEKAEDYFHQSLSINQKAKITAGLANNYREIGRMCIGLGQWAKAKEQLLMALDIDLENHASANSCEDYRLLSQVLAGMHQYAQAWNYQVTYNYLRDSLFDKRNAQRMQIVEWQKKESEQQQINLVKEAESKHLIQRQKNAKYVFLFLMVAVLVVAVVLLNSYLRKRKDNKLISRQNEEIQKANTELNVLFELSADVSSTLDIEKVMELIYSHISRLMPVSFFIISSYDELQETTSVVFCMKKGERVNEEFTTSLANRQSFSAICMRTRSDIFINDLETEYSHYLEGSPTLHGKEDLYCESLIFIPLLLNGVLIGLFSVQSEKKNAYTRQDLALLHAMTNVIAVALHNSHSFEKLMQANKEISLQKALVEHKNTEIIDSIEYARRIQRTILPPPRLIEECLQDSFILYLPKDIVAGDFYWISPVPGTKKVLIAVCDCTGHGVPGAMVSVVCSQALSKVVNEWGIIQPSLVLDKVSEYVVQLLGNNNDEGDELKDGMDASVALLDTETRELQWAGANNPLVIIRNKELTEYKADKQPVGKMESRAPYTPLELSLQEGDTIYLFTDGFADQFGGEKGKKLTRKKMYACLSEITHLSAAGQKQKLLDFYHSYKGDMPQVDDICVMGIKV